MTDQRTRFEKVLQERLTAALAAEPRLTVTRNKVRVRAASGTGVVGTLSLRYVTNARGYTLLGFAPEPAELRELREEQPPPYGSRLLTDYAFAFTTSGERWRTFAPTAGGAVRAPQTEAEIEPTCEWITERLTGIFVPRLLNLVDLRPGVVGDVLENPGYYAWPAHTVVAALRKNGLTRADVDADRLLGRHVSRNRTFDTALLDALG